MSKLEKMLAKVKETTTSTSTYYYGYVEGRRCNQEYCKFFQGSVYLLQSPISDIEITYVTRKSCMDSSVWAVETAESLRKCLHNKNSSTSWTGIGNYVVILKANKLFVVSVYGDMRGWTIDSISFEDDVAIISGKRNAPNMMGGDFSGPGFRPGDMGYYKEEYTLEVPQVDKLPF